MSHEFEYPTVREIPEVRESLTPDTFAVFPERGAVEPMETTSLRELGRQITRYVTTDLYDEG